MIQCVRQIKERLEGSAAGLELLKSNVTWQLRWRSSSNQAIITRRDLTNDRSLTEMELVKEAQLDVAGEGLVEKLYL